MASARIATTTTFPPLDAALQSRIEGPPGGGTREVCLLASRISFISPTADRVLIVTNPVAGSRLRRETIHDLVVRLNVVGLKAEVIDDLAQLADLIEAYRAAGRLRAVVAAGGDGTVAEVVNRAPHDVPISVYPLGTANLLAGYFKLECDSQSLANTLAEGATVKLDAGNANGRIFLTMVGCGFDGEVVERLHTMRAGRHISYWTYARPILEAIQSYPYPELRIICQAVDGQTTATTLSACWAFIVNLPVYAGGLRLAPDAVATDGLLDVCTFDRGSFWHALKYLGFVAIGQHRVLADCTIARAQRIRIESDARVPYQLDGDPGGLLPLDIEILPGRLTLAAPYSRLLALGLESSPHHPRRSPLGAE